MCTDCLLVIENDSPLNFALEILLGSRSGINPITSKATSAQELVDEVCGLNTQVIVLEKSENSSERNSLAQLLTSHPALKIIVIESEGNTMHVFRRDEIMIESSTDLLDAIQSK